MLLAAPVQGSTFPDLRERAARELSQLDFDIYPLGAVVPLMESYRYSDLVDVIVASKKGLSPAAPVHLTAIGPRRRRTPMRMSAACTALSARSKRLDNRKSSQYHGREPHTRIPGS